MSRDQQRHGTPNGPQRPARPVYTGRNQESLMYQQFAHRAVGSIELGKVAVSIEIAQKLADALEVPLSRLWKEIEKDA